MFDRGRNDGAGGVTGYPVEIALPDGSVAKGKLLLAAGRSVADALNGPGAFIEFEPYGGERSFIAKGQLVSVRLIGAPRSADLAARVADHEGFDPYRILGLRVGAGRDEIRAAYFALAKAYHPDRYATVELPAEVRDYLAAMVRRINAAYAALDVPERKRAIQAEPIFTSAGR
jgi:hypothetical protein